MRDWKAKRDVPTQSARHTRDRRSAAAPRSASPSCSPTATRSQVLYRLLPDDPALQIEAVVTKQPLAEPHAHLPAAARRAEIGLGRRLRDRRRDGKARRRAAALCQPPLHHHAALHPHRRRRARVDGAPAPTRRCGRSAASPSAASAIPTAASPARTRRCWPGSPTTTGAPISRPTRAPKSASASGCCPGARQAARHVGARRAIARSQPLAAHLYAERGPVKQRRRDAAQDRPRPAAADAARSRGQGRGADAAQPERRAGRGRDRRRHAASPPKPTAPSLARRSTSKHLTGAAAKSASPSPRAPGRASRSIP